LIVDDPDAPSGVFNHWVLFNLPPNYQQLEESVPKKESLPSGGLQGKNSSGIIGYMGPCPPRGPIHHYIFTLYALDKPLESKPGVSKEQILKLMAGHVLDQAKLVGIYKR
jgi:Raf kinase inhibitor-like YbhB/YbcL family protein